MHLSGIGNDKHLSKCEFHLRETWYWPIDAKIGRKVMQGHVFVHIKHKIWHSLGVHLKTFRKVGFVMFSNEIRFWECSFTNLYKDIFLKLKSPQNEQPHCNCAHSIHKDHQFTKRKKYLYWTNKLQGWSPHTSAPKNRKGIIEIE